MKQKELIQLSTELIDGGSRAILSTLTGDEKSQLLHILRERLQKSIEALLETMEEAKWEIIESRKEIAHAQKELAKIKGYAPETGNLLN